VSDCDGESGKLRHPVAPFADGEQSLFARHDQLDVPILAIEKRAEV
jgi:hypothetical protein